MTSSFDDLLSDVLDDDIEDYFGQKDKINALMIQQGIQSTEAYDRDYKSLKTLPQDPEYIGFNLYTCSQVANTTLASNATINTKTVVVTSATGIVAGQAINIVQGSRIFQSLVTNVNVTTITLASPLDFSFTSGAYVCVGAWNMNVDGSVTPVTFKISSPPETKLHITAISITIIDNAEMDDAKFGGITALTNGIICRRVDGDTFNYFLITNNRGFFQAGYNKNYNDRAGGTGVYGVEFRKELRNINGNVIVLDGTTDDELQFIVNDNLTGLTEFVISIHGHISED